MDYLSKDESGDKVTGVIPKKGLHQFVFDNGKGDDMALMVDMALIWDPTFRKYIEIWAKDEDQFRKDFGAAFKKMTELG